MADFTGTFSGHPFTFRLRVEESLPPDAANNRSLVTWSETIIKTGNFTPHADDGSPTWAVNIAGVPGSGHFGPYSFNGGIGQAITIASGSLWITHGADGKAHIAVSGSCNALATIFTAGASGEMDLARIPKIPGAATGVAAVVASHDATVSWTAPADNGGSAITGYKLDYSNDSGSTWRGAVTLAGGPHVFTGLPGGDYQFRVTPINAIGPGPATVSSSVHISGGGRVVVGGALKDSLWQVVQSGTLKNLQVQVVQSGTLKEAA